LSRAAALRVHHARPIVVNGEVVGVVLLSRSARSLFKGLYADRGKIILGIFLVLLLLLLLTGVLSRGIVRPVEALGRATRDLASGRGSLPDPPKTAAIEIQDLYRDFQRMADAIEREDFADLRDELGDLLLQSVYHTAMGEEAGHFSFQSVVRNISDKMVARHPHVFGDESRDKSAEQQTADWEKIKAAERAGKAQGGTLDGVAIGLPALLRAMKLQKRAARVGFDWPETTQVLDKITEEAAELVEAKDTLSQAEVEEEYGDILFVMANLGRHLGLDPEAALRAANAKFTRRFEGIEARLAAMGKTPQDSDLAEMDALWDAVKLAERG
jgi:ATP diphosphatase